MQLPAPLVALVTLLAPCLAAADSIPSNNASLLWGPYRPNLYLGIRPRVPESLLMGLMWGKLEDGWGSLRHTCEQTDGMASYGWTAYDTRSGGTQIIEDVKNKMNITTEFVKKYEGQRAGNWALRVKGTPRKDAPAGMKTSVVFYVGMEGLEKCPECRLDVTTQEQGLGDDLAVDTVDFHIKHPKLGSAKMQIPSPNSKTKILGGRHENTAVNSLKTTDELLWQAKSLFVDLLKDGFKPDDKEKNLLIPNKHGEGNLHFVQIEFKDSFEFDVLYSNEAATVPMTSAELPTHLDETLAGFTKNFTSVFAPQTPFVTDGHRAFSENLFSNLLGGLGYFYGKNKVDVSHAPEYAETTAGFWEKIAEKRKKTKPESKGPHELLTHVPSRPVFPRGFLWDEGFHLITVLEWDADLAIEVLRNWLALMDDAGWIAREQILGAEAESKVPEEFQVQLPDIANPPTLFWIVSRYLDFLQNKVKYRGHDSVYLEHSGSSKALIAEIYPLLKRHYEWFRRTQFGDVEAHSIPSAKPGEGYRWRGRAPNNNFASGLDDFPRAEPPHISELHVDALSWVYMMAETLERLALPAKKSDDMAKFQGHQRAIRHNLEHLHWDDKKNMHCDAWVKDDVHTLVCPPGYVSLFPFMLGLLGPEHPHLEAVLDMIHDPERLWTDHGVRSLAPSSTYYGMGDNYWRSPIWININYLIIERLHFLAGKEGPHQQRCKEIYTELRLNVAQTVYKSWAETGFAWEQYDPAGGHGQRTQHFTGWTSLVVKIMAMPDLTAQDAGLRAKFGGLIQGARAHQGWNAGSIVLILVLLVFLYFTRRRFAGTLRSLRRG